MRRRDFIRLAGIPAALALGGRADGGQRIGDDDRAPDRDAMAIHRSTPVVDGLDVSELDEKYLDLLRRGGVTCWHKSVASVDAFADCQNFVDAHADRVTVATTVAQIRQAHDQKKVALVFGSQSAEFLADP